MKVGNAGTMEDRNFTLLCQAYAVSQFGTAFSAGAILVIAVRDLGGDASSVALLLGVSRLVAALLSVPAGALVERRRKRPILVGTDVVLAVVTISVPVLIWTGHLSLVVLGVVGAVATFAGIVSGSASGAHLKDLLDPSEWSSAYARLDTIDWTFMAIFTPLGGVIVSIFGATTTMTIDAVTFLLSAIMIRRITQPERTPINLEFNGVRSFVSEATAGWRYLWSVPQLRSLFQNAMLFGGSLRMVTPLLAVLALRDLNLHAWQYATILGLPAVGGVIGARMANRIVARYSRRNTILYFGSARTFWTLWICFAFAGFGGFVFILAAELLLMFCAGVFNPIHAALRVSLTNDDFMARTGVAWGSTAMMIQPLFMIVGGLLAAEIGVRSTIAVAGILLLSSSVLLPWRSLDRGVEDSSELAVV